MKLNRSDEQLTLKLKSLICIGEWLCDISLLGPALGRGMEGDLKLVKQRGYKMAIGDYYVTQQNSQVKDFILNTDYTNSIKSQERQTLCFSMF